MPQIKIARIFGNRNETANVTGVIVFLLLFVSLFISSGYVFGFEVGTGIASCLLYDLFLLTQCQKF
jgi:hypothetical protein